MKQLLIPTLALIALAFLNCVTNTVESEIYIGTKTYRISYKDIVRNHKATKLNIVALYEEADKMTIHSFHHELVSIDAKTKIRTAYDAKELGVNGCFYESNFILEIRGGCLVASSLSSYNLDEYVLVIKYLKGE